MHALPLACATAHAQRRTCRMHPALPCPPQDLNPLPLVAIIANCTSWMLYGCINRDPYVIAANEPGLLLVRARNVHA